MNIIDRELFEAVKENILPEVRRLLSIGADVNAKDSRYSYSKWTPLHWASLRGHLQVFKALLEHGADIEAKDNDGWTPLHNAAINAHLAVVNELLGHNDSNGATSNVLGKRKSRGGASIEAKNNAGDTPLQCAIMRGHLPVVKALLSGGANILAVNNLGAQPIRLAVKFERSAVAKYLFQQLYATIRRLPLHKLVEDLTWFGNPNSTSPPLRLALDRDMLGTNGVVDILEYLVDRDPTLLSARDEDGSLPLHLACRRGASFPIIQSLVNHDKASVKSVTPQGDLPLFLACEMPQTSLNTLFLLMKLYPDLVYR
jgi:ankyrin repeat protein